MQTNDSNISATTRLPESASTSFIRTNRETSERARVSADETVKTYARLHQGKTKGLVDNPSVQLERTTALTQNTPKLEVSMIPYQIWEGYVTSVISSERRFTADLHDKSGTSPSYSADISLGEIDPEDTDLVIEGAVFYWTFGKVNAHKANSFNYDQIRFRRLPNWSKIRLSKIEAQASNLYEFFREAD
jgi:hypothetical protein